MVDILFFRPGMTKSWEPFELLLPIQTMRKAGKSRTNRGTIRGLCFHRMEKLLFMKKGAEAL